MKDGTILVDALGTFWEVCGEHATEMCPEDGAWHLKISEFGDYQVVAESGEELYKFLNSDEEFAAKIVATGDEEEDHVKADGVLLDILRKLGFAKTVAAFESLPKFYA